MPTPEPWFSRELRRIDPDLRVAWAFDRYFTNQWVIERRIPPERYFAMYASILESGESRFVQQPIFDTDKPLMDENGEIVGYTIVGYRNYDLAPEFECVLFTASLDGRVLTELKRSYAWERNHPISRLAFEKAQEEAAKLEARTKKNVEIGLEGVHEAWREAGLTVPIAPPKTVMEGTELYEQVHT